MNRSRFLSLSVVTLLSLFLFLLALFGAGRASARVPDMRAPLALAPQAQLDGTTLSVTIRSSPYAPLDSNTPADPAKLHVVVLEAVVENTGLSAASDVELEIDYDAPSGWELLEGEERRRSLGSLDPGAHGFAYWFATYPVPDTSESTLTHTYTVTASAANAASVSTSKSTYDDMLDPGATIETGRFGFLETGNTQIINTSGDVGVGTVFTMTVSHTLGTNARSAIFGPAGNLSFDASTMQLVDVDVVVRGDAGATDLANQIFVPDVPSIASGNIGAEVTYAFLPQRPGHIILCPYAAVLYQSSSKYGNNYCAGDNVLDIDATLSLSFTTGVDRVQVEQGELLTYTLTYTNNRDLAITNAWFWSEVDPSVGTVLPGTMSPSAGTGQSTAEQAVWSLGQIGPHASGTLTFQVLVDGNGSDLPDGSELMVTNYFGIEPGDILPNPAAISETLTTTVEAPSLAIAKSDGVLSAEPGDTPTYEVQVTNNGSIAAENVVITDVLPTGVTYSGGAGETGSSGQTLIWNDQTPIEPGETVTLTIPVTVDLTVDDGTVLTNTVTAGYENGAGYRFDQLSASDETTVDAPVMSIAKSASSTSVLTARPLTYTLTYSNDGPTPASNVVITDVVPSGSSYDSCSPSPCSLSGNTVTWTVGDVPADSTGDVILTVIAETALATGSELRNDDYGLVSDQSGFISGPDVTTTVFRNAAIFDGYAFVDTDLDGVFDAGELPLPGVPLTLTEALTDTDISAADGSYAFRVEQEGPVTVSAGLPSTYFRTTIGTVPAQATFGVTQTINFGYAPVETAAATITGIVYDDANGNGSRDAGELGIQGVTVGLAGVGSTTTDVLGRYTLSTTVSGPHTVIETDPGGYVSTTPNSVNVSVEAGNNYQVDFGDMADSSSVAAVYGTVFEDRDGNGQQDPDELGIAGVEITLDGSTTTTTDIYGAYTFATVAGNHTVTETNPSGYLSTTPDSVNVHVETGASARVDFGDVGPDPDFAVILGTVFEDADADGIQDSGELGIAGVELTLDGRFNATTNDNGGYVFATSSGSHTVVESDPSGFVSTTPNSVNVDVVSGSNYQIDFGDVVESSDLAVVYGTVFADANGDGLQGPGELGIAGVEISLDGSAGTTTNAYGGYTLTPAAGNHSVAETDPPGYFSTTPNSVNLAVTTGNAYQVDFGDAPITVAFASIYGTVFNDANGDGLQGTGELGLDGVEVTLDDTTTATTNAWGHYTFATDPGSRRVSESDPAGYISTTPNEVFLDVLGGSGYQVDFGDRAASDDGAFIYGTVFADANTDGVQGLGEPGLANVEVTLDGTVIATTNLWGSYTLSATVGAVHTLVETDPAGYFSTTPNEVSVDITAAGSYQVDFGDILATAGRTAIYGTVYEDADRDGSRAAGETGIAGVTVSLNEAEQVTDVYGRYTFPITEAGSYTVVETDLFGYASSTPNEVPVTLTLEASERVDFGDYRLCEVDGYEEDDDMNSAAALTPGSQQARNFCDDAVDWVSLAATAGSEYRFTTVASGQRTDTVLTLYTADGQTALAGNDDAAGATDFSSELLWVAPADGTYLLRVHNRAGLFGFATEYSLSVEETVDTNLYVYLPLIRRAPQNTQRRLPPSRSRLATSGYGAERSPAAPDGEIVHACPDDYEVDDRWTLARPLVSGVLEVHSFDSDTSMYAADKDFFQIDLAPLATLSVSVTPVPGTGTLLELYDPHGNMLDVSGTTALFFDGPPGRYYLSVSPTGDAFGCADEAGYTIEAEITGAQLYLPYLSRADTP